LGWVLEFVDEEGFEVRAEVAEGWASVAGIGAVLFLNGLGVEDPVGDFLDDKEANFDAGSPSS
jgi:hypothetical protein